MQNKGIVSVFAVAVLCATSLVQASQNKDFVVHTGRAESLFATVTESVCSGVTYVGDKTTQVLDSKYINRTATGIVLATTLYKGYGYARESYNRHKAQAIGTGSAAAASSASVESTTVTKTISTGKTKDLRTRFYEALYGDEEYRALQKLNKAKALRDSKKAEFAKIQKALEAAEADHATEDAFFNKLYGKKDKEAKIELEVASASSSTSSVAVATTSGSTSTASVAATTSTSTTPVVS